MHKELEEYELNYWLKYGDLKYDGVEYRVYGVNIGVGNGYKYDAHDGVGAVKMTFNGFWIGNYVS
jgi:hypothetical protein